MAMKLPCAFEFYSFRLRAAAHGGFIYFMFFLKGNEAIMCLTFP